MNPTKKEEILQLEASDPRVDAPCRGCDRALEAGNQIAVCPRCKSVHHLDCWISYGGCARRGCRQVVSPELRPPKVETPIQVRKVPAWVIWSIVAVVVALGAGIAYNARVATLARQTSAYVLVPASEDPALWRAFESEYNQTPTGEAHPAHVLLTPSSRPMGRFASYFEQKLLVMMAAQDGPEVTVLDLEQFETFLQQGALLPVTEIYDALVAEGLEFDEEASALAQKEGEVYGIPHPEREAYLVIPIEVRNLDAAHAVLPNLVRYLYGRRL